MLFTYAGTALGFFALGVAFVVTGCGGGGFEGVDTVHQQRECPSCLTHYTTDFDSLLEDRVDQLILGDFNTHSLIIIIFNTHPLLFSNTEDDSAAAMGLLPSNEDVPTRLPLTASPPPLLSPLSAATYYHT